MKVVKIKTLDHFEIAATIFEPEISNQKLLLINSATGVRQQTYYDFAKYFAEKGFTAITYDYRGTVSYTHLDVYKRQRRRRSRYLVFFLVVANVSF